MYYKEATFHNIVIGPLPQVSSAPDLRLLRGRKDSESSSEEKGDANMADKVYTVGCFDLLHRGHVKLFKNMRSMGREVCGSIINYSIPNVVCGHIHFDFLVDK